MNQSIQNLNRRHFLAAGSAGALSLAASGAWSKAPAAPRKRKPNILLIITDQQNINAVSASGNQYIHTPAMDHLAQQGVSYSESYCPYPLCSPARASIFTSRMPSENGVWKNGGRIIPSMPNMGQWFSGQTNYETVYAGKWHIPQPATLDIPGFNVITPGINGQGNIGDSSVAEACAGYINNRKASNPFLMVASFLQPHDICQWLRINCLNQDTLRYPEIADQLPPLPDNFQYDASEPQTQIKMRNGYEPVKGQWNELHWRYYIWSYMRHVEMVDAEIGRVLDALETSRQADNTLVLFTADHGEGCGHHQMVRKSSLYDEAAKVPTIACWPGVIQSNITDAKRLVCGTDILPTFCDYAGVKPPQGTLGKSLRNTLEGKNQDNHDSILVEGSDSTGKMIRSEQYKYISYLNDPTDQLFDIKNDPGETRNLARSSKHASILQEHKKLRDEWNNRLEYSANLPKENHWPQG